MTENCKRLALSDWSALSTQKDVLKDAMARETASWAPVSAIQATRAMIVLKVSKILFVELLFSSLIVSNLHYYLHLHYKY